MRPRTHWLRSAGTAAASNGPLADAHSAVLQRPLPTGGAPRWRWRVVRSFLARRGTQAARAPPAFPAHGTRSARPSLPRKSCRLRQSFLQSRAIEQRPETGPAHSPRLDSCEARQDSELYPIERETVTRLAKGVAAHVTDGRFDSARRNHLRSSQSRAPASRVRACLD